MKYIKSFKIFESVGKDKISDMDKYTSQMKHTYIDKLFFLEKIKDIDCLVDFGCADGFILSEINKLRPDIRLIGYDLDKNMLSLAKEKNKDALLTNSWSEVISEISNYNNVCLNLSSVIHEVYSYSHGSKVKEFWNNVFNSGFKYITIRDMIPSVHVQRMDWSEFLEDTKKVNKIANKRILKSFEDRWGLIDNDYRTFLHFLLKYKYTDNWNREVNENYLPVTLETLKKKIPSNYSIVYEDDFILPYLKDIVRKDFDIEIRNSTHVKMILKNQ